MKEFHPEQLKKLTGTLPKVDLNVDNFELWMTVMSAVESSFLRSAWILSLGSKSTMGSVYPKSVPLIVKTAKLTMLLIFLIASFALSVT